MQALKLEALAIHTGLIVDIGHDRGDATGIMRGELGKKSAGAGKQLARANQVAQVGIFLAGKHRVVRQALYLGLLDLAVPVCALDQADHEPSPGTACQRFQPVDHRGSPFLVGLHHESQPVPTCKRGFGREFFEQRQ